MFHLTIAMLLIGAIVLLLGVVLAVRAFIEKRNGEMAPFRDYFGPEYDRDLRRQSAFSDSEDWRADYQSRFTPFRLRDPEANNQETRVSGATQWDRESN
jgi:hypothetical protein